MKKILVVAIALIASVSSFAQVQQVSNKTTTTTKKLSKQMTFEVTNGLSMNVNLPVVVRNYEKIDSAFTTNAYPLVEASILKANLELKFSMKDRYSYKPLEIAGENAVFYFEYKDKQYFVVDLVVEAKNGYGNPITKKYSVWILYNKNEQDISKALTYERTM